MSCNQPLTEYEYCENICLLVKRQMKMKQKNTIIMQQLEDKPSNNLSSFRILYKKKPHKCKQHLKTNMPFISWDTIVLRMLWFLLRFSSLNMCGICIWLSSPFHCISTHWIGVVRAISDGKRHHQ